MNKLTDFFVNYFSFSGQLVSQAEAEASIRDGVSFKGTNIVILIIAIFIASLGLNTNSTAVIIGAMLISPLMGPIIGIGLAIGIHDYDLLKRCVRNLLMAASFSMIAATLYFLISPVNENHSELLARTSPTIYDVFIGFFGGGAGIIALGSKNKGNVIPGVAIATALMPPLCTAGYGLATWQLNYFFGASYLFVINSIYIAFATFIGVKLMKYKGVVAADPLRARKVRRIVYTLAILTMLPSIYLTYRMFTENNFNMEANRFVKDECNFPETQVLNCKAYMDHGHRYLTLTLIGQPLDDDSLKAALTDKLRFYDLAGTQLNIIQGSRFTYHTAANSTSAEEVYRLAQGTISRQQTVIDSLNSLLNDTHAALVAAPTIAPELKVVFPEIAEIGISTMVFTDPQTQSADTATVALVHTAHRKLDQKDSQRLADYLTARLGYRNVKVIDMP